VIAVVAPPTAAAGRCGAVARARETTLATVADLVAAAPVPELLARLVLAQALTLLVAEAQQGRVHGRLTAESLRLTGAPPARLLADCPRDPRLALAGTAEAADAPGMAPALDLLAIAGIVRDLLAGGRAAPELERLLAAMTAARAEDRPSLPLAAERARELALAGLAAWQRARTALAEPALPPLPERAYRELARPPLRARDDGETAARSPSHPPPRLAVGVEEPPRIVLAESAFGAAVSSTGRVPLWLSVAPTAMASLLSALLATALLLTAVQ